MIPWHYLIGLHDAQKKKVEGLVEKVVISEVTSANKEGQAAYDKNIAATGD